MATAPTRLAQAARIIPTDKSSLRRALNRFGILDCDDDGQRVIDPRIVALFAQTKRTSGYLYPRDVDTLEKLLAAASQITKVPSCVANTILRHVEDLSCSDAERFFAALRDRIDEIEREELRDAAVAEVAS